MTIVIEDLGNIIGGEERPARSGRWIDDIEPATGVVVARCAASDANDVDDAVAAATRALPAWSRMPVSERAARIEALAAIVERDLERFVRAESIDGGKPIALARAMDIPRAVTNLRYFAGLSCEQSQERSETDAMLPGGTRGSAVSVVERPAAGVAACISPWNLPLYLFTWKVGPALAAGCTVVGKPSELTPMTATMLGRAASEAGLPPGVLNILHGRGAEAGQPLVEHPSVAVVTFTGGTATGAAIALAAAPRFKRLALELGGKNPTIVCSDVGGGGGPSFDDAMGSIVRSAFLNQGQICLCGSRILVERSVLDRVRDALVTRTRALRQGDPLDEHTEQGSLVSRDHLAKVSRAVEEAKLLGGRILCGGAAPVRESLPARCAGGAFHAPTLIEGLSPKCRTNQEEIFGPVATIIPFDGDDEAIDIANGVRYGLAASVWSGDRRRAERIATSLHAGTVWINCWLVRDLSTPFGGWKESGVGREGGVEALHFFSESRTLVSPR